MAKGSSSLNRPRKREGLKIRPRLFQIDHFSLKSADSYLRDSYCSPRFFQNLPASAKHYVVFDVFADFQSLFQPENLGSHKSHVSTDDRFLPQGQQILPKIHQVRPMPTTLIFFFNFLLTYYYSRITWFPFIDFSSHSFFKSRRSSVSKYKNKGNT